MREIALKQFPGDESFDAMNKSVDPDSSIAAFSKKKTEYIVKPSNKFTRSTVQPARTVSRDISPQELDNIPVVRQVEQSKIPHISIMRVVDKPTQQPSERRNLKFGSSGKKGTVPEYLKDSGYENSIKSKNTAVGTKKTSGLDKSSVKRAVKPSQQMQPALYEEDAPVRRQFITEIRNSENGK